MIISEKWKYIFVGLPFSASSAISKELVENYDGKPILGKHSNITDLIRLRDINDFIVFAVYRDPLEINFTQYSKYLGNAHNVYTDPECFIENGGWVTKRARKFYTLVHGEKIDFELYVRKVHKTPYDSVYSMNRKYLDYIVDFSDLNESFHDCLKMIGIDPIRDLPIFNKTKNKHRYTIGRKLKNRVFGPFYIFNTNVEVNVPWYSSMFYRLAQPLRFYIWKRKDVSRRNRIIGDYKNLVSRSKEQL